MDAHPQRRWPRRLVSLLGGLFLGVAVLWAAGAIGYSGIAPAPWPWVLAAGVLVGLLLAAFLCPNRRAVALAALALVVLVIALWQFKHPRTDRTWMRDMAVLPTIEIEGSRVTIRNVRDSLYRSPDDFDVRHVDRTFDLDRLRTVDFLVERFSDIEALAHTLLTFGFEGGEYVAVSVELRREEGESFHPLAGIYRQYELMYVIGTERDLIGLRTNHRKSRAWLFPIRATPAAMRALFLGMLERTVKLQREPEFYNTLTSSCTTNIVDHVQGLVPGGVPFSFRVVFPGHVGSFAYELDLIDTDLPYEEAEVRFRIDEIAQEGGDGPGFSERIRAHR